MYNVLCYDTQCNMCNCWLLLWKVERGKRLLLATTHWCLSFLLVYLYKCQHCPESWMKMSTGCATDKSTRNSELGMHEQFVHYKWMDRNRQMWYPVKLIDMCVIKIPTSCVESRCCVCVCVWTINYEKKQNTFSKF